MSSKPATEPSAAAWAAEDLRAWRKRLGFTVAEAGARLGRTEDAMKQLLSGRRRIGPGVRAAAEQAERQLADARRPRREPAAPQPPAAPEPTTTAVADEALLDAAVNYAGMVADHVEAELAKTLVPAHIAAANAAATAANALTNARRYSPEGGARASRVLRCGKAAMDAMVERRKVLRELEAIRAAAEHEELAPDLAEYVGQMVDGPDESEPDDPGSDEMFEPQVFHGRNGDAGNGTSQTLLAGKGSGWSVQDGPLLVVLEPSGDRRLDAAHARLMRARIEQEAANTAAEEAKRKVNAAQKAVDRAQAAWEEK
ncbi:MAG: hypothetical protein JWR00_938 [Rubritepida sp.]|nr:hypothetical protein [Rubritepida sp.]